MLRPFLFTLLALLLTAAVAVDAKSNFHQLPADDLLVGLGIEPAMLSEKLSVSDKRVVRG